MKNGETMVRAALAGNPNVGKSTVFNALTGLRQHTGNWPGKTVSAAEGFFTYGDQYVSLTDLPGIYSLACRSAEEEAAREFLETRPDVTVVVADASSLERCLILWGQIRAMGLETVLCVNLMDEAEKRGIRIDRDALRNAVDCPVVFTSARSKLGLDELRRVIVSRAGQGNPAENPPCDTENAGGGGESPEMGGYGWENTPHAADPVSCGGNCPDCGGSCTEIHVRRAERIAAQCTEKDGESDARDRRIDRIVCGKYTAVPIMLLLCGLVLWLTVCFSSYLSAGLEMLSGAILAAVRAVLEPNLPKSLASLLCDGVVSTVLQVVSVMLPPMAVFFPLFTILEDLGYLPRAAFNLDRCFAGCGSCGKQALTMLMGLGCNAAAVSGCRIIDSPRERAVAVITNSFIPCNGRLPILFAMLGVMGLGNFSSMAILMGLLVFAVLVTLAVSKLLSATVLRGNASSFALELPPYRIPQIGQTLVRAFLDRCVYILGRAVRAAAPAGVFIWLIVRWEIGGVPLYAKLSALLDPVGKAAGMDGVLMLSFLLAFPAAELVLPLAAAGYTLTAAGMPQFSAVTAGAVILFAMFHWPCAAALLTVRHEYRCDRRGWLYTVLAALIPTVIGYGLCVLWNLVWR